MITKKVLYLIIGALSVSTVALTIAFASLSENLFINFANVTQSVESWNVGFVAGDITGSASGSSETGLSCGTASVNATSVSVADTTISKPGDKCVYELTIQNTGTIDATLASITNSAPSSVTCTSTDNVPSMECGNITYKLTTDAAGESLFATNTTLEHNKTQKVYLTAAFTGTNIAATATTQTGARFTLLYNQQ